MSVLVRLMLTVTTFAIFGYLNLETNAAATLVSGKVAGSQLEASDSAYLASTGLLALLHGGVAIPLIGLLVVLGLIWSGPMRRLLRHVLPLSIAMLALASGHQARAFFETTDKTEVYTILPNESAFWIPDVGDNKTAQTAFDSAQYLAERKLAAKRFIIPHHKLSGSGGTAWTSGADYYVPDGRLIIVDRTPYSREWVTESVRGSSSKNEGQYCQSREGLNITTGIAIGTSVHEQDAPLFLYRFGVRQDQNVDRTDGHVIFASVFYGRSLTQVMDEVVRPQIQAAICEELGKRAFDQANAEMIPIIQSVRENMTKTLAANGITLDFIGWADAWTFDAPVQYAIDEAYVAKTTSNYVQILRDLADIRVKEGLGDGLRTKGLPQNLIAIPDHLLGALTPMFGGKPSAAP